MSINEDGVEILIPTVEHSGRGVLSDKDAITQWRKTGKHLGKFKTAAAATAYAKRLHEDYERGVYDPKPENAGQAEIIVAKHRSGPTGVVQLAYLPQYTRFANMARGFD